MRGEGICLQGGPIRWESVHRAVARAAVRVFVGSMWVLDYWAADWQLERGNVVFPSGLCMKGGGGCHPP
eukprot:1182122-Prorocentrum_minimum.AAC.2